MYTHVLSLHIIWHDLFFKFMFKTVLNGVHPYITFDLRCKCFTISGTRTHRNAINFMGYIWILILRYILQYFCLFCLIVWFFWGGGVYSYGDVSITGEWAHVFDLYLALVAIEQWRFFSVPHLLWHGSSVYVGHLWGPVTLTSDVERLAVELSITVLMIYVCRTRGSNTNHLHERRMLKPIALLLYFTIKVGFFCVKFES